MKPFQKSTRRQWRERILQRGFSAQFDFSEVAAAADIVASGVSQANSGKSASRAMKKIYDIVEISTRGHSQVQLLACKKGCNYCCHQYVSASPLELFYLANMIKNAADEHDYVGPVDHAATLLKDTPQAEITNHKTRCGLLTDACSVYPGRPISCRGYASEDVEKCISWLTDRSVGVPINMQHINFANMAKIAIWAALLDRKLPRKSYELNHGLNVVMSMDDAEDRWLRGENIFAGVKGEEYADPDINNILRQVMILLARSR